MVFSQSPRFVGATTHAAKGRAVGATCVAAGLVGPRNNLSDQLQLLLYSASTLGNFMPGAELARYSRNFAARAKSAAALL